MVNINVIKWVKDHYVPSFFYGGGKTIKLDSSTITPPEDVEIITLEEDDK